MDEKTKLWLRSLIQESPEAFRGALSSETRRATSFLDLIALCNLRKKALATLDPKHFAGLRPFRLAVIGGYSFHPLIELISQDLFARGYHLDVFLGEYDNYHSEILEENSPLYGFKPNAVLFFPSPSHLERELSIDRSVNEVVSLAEGKSGEILSLCVKIHEKTRTDVLLANYIPSPHRDLGPIRSRIPGSPSFFLRQTNLFLGLNAPAFVRILDLDFLSCRRGLVASKDARSWFESKQPFSKDLMIDAASEIGHLIDQMRAPPKKVLVLDMDNTLYGGVVGDDGVEKLVLDDISATGQAFKAFQYAILELNKRGVLLAVCSKNDEVVARSVFERHPEMVLRSEHISSFKANWGPKPDNIKMIAEELNLGLDSFVFVDDNPAEIEIVNQFLPEVATILLGDDPSEYSSVLRDCRFFEPSALTAEDLVRVQQYRARNEEKKILASVTDMGQYLSSLQMAANIRAFTPQDIPRVSQLINKSNQFNLTSIRRSEAELLDLMRDPEFFGFSVRLSDRLADHGLISVVILRQAGRELHIDTWLMSCRVLKRQVEEAVMNHIVTIARKAGCSAVLGTYLRTEKNAMVADLLEKMGFSRLGAEEPPRFRLAVDSFDFFELAIKTMEIS